MGRGGGFGWKCWTKLGGRAQLEARRGSRSPHLRPGRRPLVGRATPCSRNAYWSADTTGPYARTGRVERPRHLRRGPRVRRPVGLPSCSPRARSSSTPPFTMTERIHRIAERTWGIIALLPSASLCMTSSPKGGPAARPACSSPPLRALGISPDAGSGARSRPLPAPTAEAQPERAPN